MLLHFVCSFERKNMRWFRNFEELSVSREITLYQMLKRDWILVLKLCMYSGLLEHEWNIRENSLALLCVEPRFVHQPQENTEPAYDFERTRREVVIDTSKYFRNLDPESKERSLGDRRNTIYISFLGTAVLRVSGLRTPLSFLLKTL